jgi:hypothetical protein
MKDFILELYSEEIPARMQKPAQVEFQRLFEEFLKQYVNTSSFKPLTPSVGSVESSAKFMAEPFNSENKSNENNSSSYEYKLDSTSATNGRSLNDAIEQ